MASLADSTPETQRGGEVTYTNTISFWRIYTTNHSLKLTCVLDFLAFALSGSSVSEAPFSRWRLALFIGEGASSLIFCGAQTADFTCYCFLMRPYQSCEQRSSPPCSASSWTPSCCQCCLCWRHWEKSVRWSANPHWWARLCHQGWLSASYDHYVALTSKRRSQQTSEMLIGRKAA